MSITLTKKDIIWGFFAQFFSIASGIITLPIILRMLTAEEIGMNYLMLTIGSLVSLFDFGFAPQFSRNITYIFSGAQKLTKEGIEIVNEKKEINYRLLKTMIFTAKDVYKRLAIIVLLVMLTFGSIYIYYVTDGFSNVKNSFIIWILFSMSTFFNIYYNYFNSLLLGKGLIMASKKAMVYSKLIYIGFTFIFLFSGIGLLGVTLANFIAPFVNRLISYNFFFTKELNYHINKFRITVEEKKELFNIIWYNAKKLGLIAISASSLNYLTTFVIGLYLSLSEVAAYGIMIQLIGIISVFSQTLFITFTPKMSYNYLRNEIYQFKKYLSISILTFFIIFLMGSVSLVMLGPTLFNLIKSNTILPNGYILTLCLIFTFFEKNQSLFSQILLFNNEIIFLKASIYTGIAITILVVVSLHLNFGLYGIVLAQGLPILAYSAWKWPNITCKKYNLNIWRDIIELGFNEIKLITLKFVYAPK